MNIGTFALPNHIFTVDDSICMDREELFLELDKTVWSDLPITGVLRGDSELYLGGFKVVYRLEINEDLAVSCWNCGWKNECQHTIERG